MRQAALALGFYKKDIKPQNENGVTPIPTGAYQRPVRGLFALNCLNLKKSVGLTEERLDLLLEEGS